MTQLLTISPTPALWFQDAETEALIAQWLARKPKWWITPEKAAERAAAGFLSYDEEARLWHDMQNGSGTEQTQARQTLARAHMGFIAKIAGGFADPEMETNERGVKLPHGEYDEMIAAARLGFAKALSRWKGPARGRLAAYAREDVRGACVKHIARRGMLEVPDQGIEVTQENIAAVRRSLGVKDAVKIGDRHHPRQAWSGFPSAGDECGGRVIRDNNRSNEDGRGGRGGYSKDGTAFWRSDAVGRTGRLTTDPHDAKATNPETAAIVAIDAGRAIESEGERDQRIFRDHTFGMTPEAIARREGIGVPRVYQIVDKAKARLKAAF